MGSIADVAGKARQTVALVAAIEAMAATLAVAEALAVERRRIDLTGLEAEVGRICAAAVVAPRDAAPDLRLRLEALRQALDRLRIGLVPP